MTVPVIPFSLKDAPALIERILPVQKLSAEVYKERMAGASQTLTALGGYWKGRKPLILNKACVLACLLPATMDLRRDLEVFERLMAMDAESLVVRMGRIKPAQILERVQLDDIQDYFEIEPDGALPMSSPLAVHDYPLEDGKLPKIAWREEVSEFDRRKLEALAIERNTYRKNIAEAKRPEEVANSVHDHIWGDVNQHLSTDAHSFPELVEQLGIMRFGHRPRVGDVFAGSGQIPFEAARLGCDVYASDLSPIACMLVWGAFNLVGGSEERRKALAKSQVESARRIHAELSRLGVETDGNGWHGKAYLYCVEAKCPQTGWKVPLLPTRIVSKGYRVIAQGNRT